MSMLSALSRNLLKGCANMLGIRFYKTRMIVEDSKLRSARRSFTNFFACSRDVLLVLPAAGIRAVSGSDEAERTFDAVAHHLAERVGQEAMPVAIAPVDGKRGAALIKLLT